MWFLNKQSKINSNDFVGDMQNFARTAFS